MESTLGRIARTVAETLGVRRVGVWLFTPDRARLEARVLVGGSARSEAIAETHAPAYFNALKKGRLLAVPRAQTHPATRELAAMYLSPRRIVSTLDVPVSQGKSLKGYLRLEHTGPERPWTSQERWFVQSMGALASVLMEKHERGLEEKAVRQSEKRLRSILDSLADLCFTQDADQRHVKGFGGSERGGEHLAGKKAEDLVDRETAEIREEAGARALAGESVTCDWTDDTGQSARHFQDALAPLRDKDGRVSGIVGIRRDVTGARNAQLLAKKFFGFLQCVSGPLTDREAALWIARFSRQLLKHDAFELHLLEGSGRIQKIYAEDTRRGEAEPRETPEVPAPAGTLVAELAAGNRPRLVRYRDEEVSGASSGSARGLGTSYSLILAPIRWQKQVMGYVSCRSYRPERYHDEDVALLQEVADLAGGVMARLKARHEVLSDEDLPRAVPQEQPEEEPAAAYISRRDAVLAEPDTETIREPESAAGFEPEEEPQPGAGEESEAEPAETEEAAGAEAPAFEEPDAPSGPPEEPGTHPLDLNDAIRKLEPRLREVLGDSIDCACLLDPTIPVVQAESSHFEKMMLAIALEASRAIEGSGQFTVETGRSEDDNACLRMHGIRRREPCVRVSVHYTGAGMDEALLGRIFAPLDAVEGRLERTPSSMSAVYDLVGRNMGHIDVYCEPGLGTTVRFYLLRARKKAGREEARLSGLAGSASGP